MIVMVFETIEASDEHKRELEKWHKRRIEYLRKKKKNGSLTSQEEFDLHCYETSDRWDRRRRTGRIYKFFD